MKRHLIAATVLATSLFTAQAFAAPETYNIDNNHTYPRFEFNHLGFSNQVGRFDKTSGQITIDTAARRGEATINIDAKSVNTGSTAFNEHLNKEDFFHTEKYPLITFKSTKFKFEGDKLAAVDGDLTIKGITKPVTLNVNHFHCATHPMAKKQACGANASTKIKRSEFNLAKHVPAVSDEVTITLSIEAIKE